MMDSSSNRFRFLAVPALSALLFALVFALFSPAIRYPLVDLDDHAYITQNRIVLQGLSPDTVRRAFAPSNDTATMYMPMLWLSYMADVTLFHATTEHPAPFHAVNVVLHALSAVFLFLVLLRLLALSSSRFPLATRHSSLVTGLSALVTPFLLALLWAVHPLRVESVAWVTERKDVLSAAFGLAATLAWLVSAHPARRTVPKLFLLFLSALLYAAGLLSKPSLVPLPLAWLALDVWPLRRIPASLRAPGFVSATLRAAAEKLLFLAFALSGAWLAIAQHHAVSGSLSVPWLKRLSAVAPNFLFYLRKTILPLGLAPLVPEQWDFSAVAVLVSLAVCAALAFCLWTWRKSLPSLLPGAVWVVLFFLPASGLQPLPMNTVADRFFYLPAMGISISLVSLPDILSRRLRRVFQCVLAVLAALLAILAFRLLPVWSSTPALFRRIADTFPGHPVAVSELANQDMRRRGDFEAAANLLLPALEKHPDHWFLRLSYSECLLQSESPDAAIDYIMAGHMPDDLFLSSQIFLTLASFEFFRGGFDDSLRYAERSLAYLPEDSTVRSLSLALAIGAAFEAGDSDKALAFARQTRFFSNVRAVTLEHLIPLGVFNWTNARREQTIPLFYRIMDAYPGRFDIWNNLVWGLATAEWSPADPDEVLRRALRLPAISPEPENPGILDTLAVAYANAGDFDSALRLVDRALEKVPDSADSLHQRLFHRRALFRDRIPYRERAFDRLFNLTFGTAAEAL